MDNKALIESFYDSFSKGNAEGMIACYHDNIVFEYPAFGKLYGNDAKKMWQMLLANNKGGIKITYSRVIADAQTGSADWTAEYLFSRTAQKVHNKIHAEFVFANGKIISHIDSFDIWRWARQALGWKAYLLGWSSFFQNKIRKQALKALSKFKPI